MKITKIEDLHADGGWRTLSYIKISTDEGIVGWAETSEGMAGPGLVMVIRRLAERLIGRDPRDVGPIGTDLYVATQMAHGGMIAQAIAALENACLDIKGKAAGLPVHALFGGAHRMRLPLYWSHCGTYRVRSAELFERVCKTPPIRTLDDIKKLGEEVIARGFKALKTNTLLFDGARPRQYRPAFGGGAGHPELNLSSTLLDAITDQLAAFREGIGSKAGLMIDLNFHFKPEGLRQIAKAVEQYRLTWLEIDSHSPDVLATIRRSTTTPIGALETVYGCRALKPFLDAQAVDVVIVDPQWNGFMEAFRIANLANIYDVNVAAHDAHGYHSTIMGAHLCAAIPNFRIMEFDVDEVPWAADFVTHPPVIENGEMLVPTGPGWGCDINEEAILAHPPKDVGGAAWLLDFHRRNGVPV
jgi:L-alanine-DL-glutamate epimerase-like enolase superfamily enzyme